MALILVGQLLGQAITLLDQGSVLGILGMKGGLRFAELLPQVSVGPSAVGQVVGPPAQLPCLRVKGGSTEVVIFLEVQTRDKNKVAVKKDPTRPRSSRPESRGLHPVGALTRPHGRN